MLPFEFLIKDKITARLCNVICVEQLFCIVC